MHDIGRFLAGRSLDASFDGQSASERTCRQVGTARPDQGRGLGTGHAPDPGCSVHPGAVRTAMTAAFDDSFTAGPPTVLTPAD
ncbi:hypothetical protein ACIBAG_15075 [Streptomyces sp. NPDC051243]|uniref:hypothetical protein n=1 Tax=Streptomyces sp. NPDC051243 TaxID=3365646 RepID=UPI0037B16491